MITISDPQDPRLADYVSLRDASLRRHLESEHGLFIAEGEKVIRRAIEAGHRPRSLLLAPRWVESLSDLIETLPQVPVLVVSEALAEQVTGFHVHRGALASLHRDTPRSVEDLLGLDRLVIMEDIVDHTNVGAVIRTAAALGWQGVVLSPRTADPLYRRSIKVSMGAVFSLPWARVEDWASTPQLLQDNGFTTVALALTDAAMSLDQAVSKLAAKPKLAIMIGTEGSGLSRRWIDRAEVVVQIPMAAGIDSLNVGAAAAIACWALNQGQQPLL